MPDDLLRAWTSIAERLIALAGEDAAFRTQLRQFAEALLDVVREPAASDPPAVPVVAVSESPAVVHKAQTPPAPVESEPPVPVPTAISQLTFHQGGSSTAEGLPAAARTAPFGEFDLARIESRCRLKAEGCRWAARRRRLLKDGANYAAEIEPTDKDIIVRAKAIPDCFLWMCHPTGPSPTDLGLYETVAVLFEAVASVLSLLRQLTEVPGDHSSEFERSLDLLAEAQSALRVAIAELDGPKDSDQMQVFLWLKATAAENQIFIRRFMRADDPADPSAAAELLARIEAVDDGLQESRRQAKRLKKLIDKVRHKASLIADRPEEAAEHWKILAATVEELLTAGLPPSNRELRELLIPVIDQLPELPDLPKSFELVHRELDRYLATCPPSETAAVARSTPEVVEAARLLAGRSLVLVGGDRRPASEFALKTALGVKELIWIPTREHQSLGTVEPYIARPDVALVALAIRLISHSHGDEVQGFCERHHKPLVRLPGGYGQNQVALQIVKQCSGKLAASLPDTERGSSG